MTSDQDQQKNSSDSNQDGQVSAQVERLDFMANTIIGTAILILLSAVSVYWFNFGDGGLSPNQTDWGQFGDYLGGSVNPILSFLTIIILVLTIRIQTEELKLSRKAVWATNKELSQSKIIASNQLKHLTEEANKRQIEDALQLTSNHIEHVFTEKAGWIQDLNFGDIFSAFAPIENASHVSSSYHSRIPAKGKAIISNLATSVVVMNGLILKHEKNSPDDEISNFFRFRYRRCAQVLVEHGYIGSEEVAGLTKPVQ